MGVEVNVKVRVVEMDEPKALKTAEVFGFPVQVLRRAYAADIKSHALFLLLTVDGSGVLYRISQDRTDQRVQRAAFGPGSFDPALVEHDVTISEGEVS